MSARKKIIAITPFICLIAFIILSYFGYSHPGWMIFLLIPVAPFLVGEKKIRFSYPLITIIIYLVIGFCFDLWHPGWVVFLTIPIFYIIFTPKDKDFDDED